MSVLREISIQTVKLELNECVSNSDDYGWEISPVDEGVLSFIVKMRSTIDNEPYHVSFHFDNYPEYPLLIDFLDPVNGNIGTRRAYPLTEQGFFHSTGPTICHPASRKAYRGYQGIHNEWDFVGWQKNPNVGGLTNINAILQAVYFRINDQRLYRGRMEK